MIEKIIDKLHKVRKTGHLSYVAMCPVHNTESTSLAIREIDGDRVLIHCFGGCDTGSVLAAIGLDFSDLFPPRTDNFKPEKIAFPAFQVLCAISHEAGVIIAAANAIFNGEYLSEHDIARIDLARERIQEGIGYAKPI